MIVVALVIGAALAIAVVAAPVNEVALAIAVGAALVNEAEFRTAGAQALVIAPALGVVEVDRLVEVETA